MIKVAIIALFAGCATFVWWFTRQFSAVSEIKYYLKEVACAKCGSGIKWEWKVVLKSAGCLNMRGMCRECESPYEAKINATVSPRSGDWSKR